MPIRSTLAPIVLVCLALVPAASRAQEPVGSGPVGGIAVRDARIGCFSPQRAYAESADGKAGLVRLTALQTEKVRAIDEKNNALQAQELALRQGGTLTEEMRIRRTRDVEQFRIDVQRFTQDAQAEVTGLQQELENAFLVKLRPAVEQVAKARGLQMVFDLDGDSVVWFEPSLDITGDVIKQLASAPAPGTKQ